MERLADFKYSELISTAFDKLPLGIASKLRYTHFFTGTSPIYAGLFDYTEASFGRSYHTVWSVACLHHQMGLPKKLRQTTIVMLKFSLKGYPMRLLPMLVVHELGHVLDELLDWSHIALPITRYAKSNRGEAFAEAFTLWLNPEYAEYYQVYHSVDERTLSLFQHLAVLWSYDENRDGNKV